jgi:hypothetical protein
MRHCSYRYYAGRLSDGFRYACTAAPEAELAAFNPPEFGGSWMPRILAIAARDAAAALAVFAIGTMLKVAHAAAACR